jgi:hypothetical protein
VIKEEGKSSNKPNRSRRNRAKNPQFTTKQASSTPVSNLVKNILLQENTYILPRPISTAVAPHRYAGNMEWSPPPPDGSKNLAAAAIVRPNPDVFLEYTVQNTDPVAVTPFSSQTATDFPIMLNDTQNISLDQSVFATNGQIVKCSTAKGGTTANHISSSAKQLKSGLKYYPGVWTVSNTQAITFSFTNTTNKSLTYVWYLGVVSAAGIASISNTVPGAAAVAAGATGITTLAVGSYATWIAQAAAAKGVWIGFALTAEPATIQIPQGLRLGVSIPGGLTVADPTLWVQKSLWDFLPEADRVIPRAQYVAAARKCVTGLMFLLQNNTPELIIGGNLYAARLPGDTHDLPGTVEGLIALISSQVHHKLTTNQLKKGLCWSYTPEKMQDWMFQESPDYDPYNGNPLNLPFLALALTSTMQEINQSISLNLSVCMSLEYLTTDPSNTFIQCFSHPGYFEALVCELSKCNVLTHNPDHIKNALNAARKVANSETFRLVLRTAGEAGLKLLPSVLAMLA